MIFFAGLLCFAFTLRLWLAAFGGIHPDEAYYWFWSKHLSLGYFDHPPMIAWLIRLSRTIVPWFIPDRLRASSPLFFTLIEFRFLPFLVSSVITPLIIGKCIQRVQKRELSLSQMIIIMSTPVFLFGPQVITPDTPFFAAWALCLYFALKFLSLRAPHAYPGDPTPTNLRIAVGAGVVLALAAYSKYSAILAAFLMAITGAGVMNSVIFGITALVLLVPYLLWNFGPGQAQGAGIFFQFQNGLGNLWSPGHYKRVGDLWLSQLMFWNPILFIAALALIFKDIRHFLATSRKHLYTGSLLLWTFTPLAFFSLSGLKRPAEGNWPLIGVIGGMVLILTRYQRNAVLLTLLLLSNVATSVLGILVLTKNQYLADWAEPISARLASELRKPSRLHEFQDWESLHIFIFEATRSESTLPIEVHTYQTLSELIFFDDVAPPAERLGSRLKIWSGGSRRSEFHILPEYNLPEVPGKRWLVARADHGLPSDCRLYQSIYKGIADPNPFAVYKCSF